MKPTWPEQILGHTRLLCVMADAFGGQKSA